MGLTKEVRFCFCFLCSQSQRALDQHSFAKKHPRMLPHCPGVRYFNTTMDATSKKSPLVLNEDNPIFHHFINSLTSRCTQNLYTNANA